jgi:hypothetical protein
MRRFQRKHSRNVQRNAVAQRQKRDAFQDLHMQQKLGVGRGHLDAAIEQDHRFSEVTARLSQLPEHGQRGGKSALRR